LEESQAFLSTAIASLCLCYLNVYLSSIGYYGLSTLAPNFLWARGFLSKGEEAGSVSQSKKKTSSKFYSIGLNISTEPLIKSFVQNRNVGVSLEMSYISVSSATS